MYENSNRDWIGVRTRRYGAGSFQLAVKYFTEVGSERGSEVIRVARGAMGTALDRETAIMRVAWLGAAFKTAHGVEAPEKAHRSIVRTH